MDDPVDYCEFWNASLRLLTIRDDIIIISMRIARFLVAIPRGIYDRRFRYGSTEKYHSSPRGVRPVAAACAASASLLHDVDNSDDRFNVTSACLSVIPFLMERIFPPGNRDDLQLLVLTLPRDQDVHVSYYEAGTRQVIKARQRNQLFR